MTRVKIYSTATCPFCEKAKTLLKRLGSPQDIAQTVVYLVAMTDFVTGHVMVVDGGRLIGK